MMIRFQHVLRFILLLSLLLLLFLGWFGFNSNNQNGTIINNNNNNNNKLQHLYVSGHRKILLASRIDFTPFLNRRHQHRHHHRHHYHHSRSHAPLRSGTEIDPRFGVDKRLVPTGPNPLHH